MNRTKIIMKKEIKAKNPILIEGLPGIGLVGKLAADHLKKELQAKKIAELYSPSFPHHVMMRDDGTIRLVRNEFYLWENPDAHGNDLILLVGDAQPMSSQGQYKVAGKILDFFGHFGGKEIITLGGYGIGTIAENPKVYGSATHKEIIDKYKEFGIDFGGAKGSIIGAAGLLLGLGKLRGFKGMCLMGETHGAYIDPKSATIILQKLTKMLKINISMDKLVESAKENEEMVKKLEEEAAAFQQSFGEFSSGKADKDLTYIR